MSDNVQLGTPSGTGDVCAADDIAGVKYQRVKLSLGADGVAADAPVGGGTESGVLRVTVASDSTGVLSVDDNGGSLTVDGTVAVSSLTTGWTPLVNLDVDETEDAIKATSGRLGWIHAVNLTSTKQYLKFYDDTVANVVVGTTTPVLTFPLPTMGDTNGAGFTINFGPQGIAFANAITVAATTGFANNDTGAPAANAVILNVGYL